MVYVQHYLHIQPSEVDALSYYEYQWMVQDLIEMLKEQNGDGKDNSYDQNEQMDKIKNQASNYTKGMNMPKMGSMGNFKMPKF